MMNLKPLFPALFFLFFTQQLFSQETKTLDSTKYKIDYPNDWIPSYLGGYGAELYIFTPKEDNTEFQENISLATLNGTTSDYNDIRSFTEFNIKAFDTYIKGLDIKTTSYDTISPVQSSILEYTGVVYNELTNFYQKIYLENNKFYILTYTSKPESNKEYREKAIKAINTFVVK